MYECVDAWCPSNAERLYKKLFPVSDPVNKTKSLSQLDVFNDADVWFLLPGVPVSEGRSSIVTVV